MPAELRRVEANLLCGGITMKLDVIRELNADHARLASTLGVLSGRPELDAEAVLLLKDVRAQLSAHLEREDRKLYPEMRAAAEKNESLREMLKVMGLEMNEISAKAVALIDGWIAGKGAGRFAEDFAFLHALLKDRIQREENKLYAKYLKL